MNPFKPALWNTRIAGSEDRHMSGYPYHTNTRHYLQDEIHYGNEHNSWTDLRFETIYFHTTRNTPRHPDYCARNCIPCLSSKVDSNTGVYRRHPAGLVLYRRKAAKPARCRSYKGQLQFEMRPAKICVCHFSFDFRV
jgi:hypothetical protein